MQNHNKAISYWLFACCVMVAVMVIIGGLTRLTGSGLSMTGWEPVTGWLPPIGDVAWNAEFARYQQSPQYLKVNSHMGVEEFKGIFWLEFIHRLIGRIAGLVFILPLIYSATKRMVSKGLAIRLSSIFILGGMQGTIGWFMVKSGLKDDPRVSEYWLAFHLSTAFIIFAILFLVALWQRYKDDNRPAHRHNLANFSIAITILIFLQVVMGGFVAGLHAGFIYNTFPLMDGKLIPNGLFPYPASVFEDIKTVQFIHRMLAYVVVGSIIALWLKSRAIPAGNIKNAINALFVMVLVQFCLGVLTLLYVVQTSLASIHQAGALILFTISLYTNYALVYKRGETN
jgi:cytochrome c oxidase assembly protein subunit 15